MTEQKVESCVCDALIACFHRVNFTNYVLLIVSRLDKVVLKLFTEFDLDPGDCDIIEKTIGVLK